MTPGLGWGQLDPAIAWFSHPCDRNVTNVVLR